MGGGVLSQRLDDVVVGRRGLVLVCCWLVVLMVLDELINTTVRRVNQANKETEGYAR